MNKYKYISSISDGKEAFAISELFNNIDDSVIYIAKDDREIFNIKEKIEWLLPDIEILIYRAWDQIPYDNVSPSKEIQSEIVKTLYSLLKKNNKKIILTSINAIIQKTIDQKFLNENIIEISTHKKNNFNDLAISLSSLGYERTSVVRDKSEFAIRGSIIDIFISDYNYPIRLDFFGDTIESIYSFDQVTQKRIEKLNISNIFINTSSELMLNQKSIEVFRKNFREVFTNYRLSSVYHSFSENILPPGGEQFISLFCKKMETIFSYLDEISVVLSVGFFDLLETRLENINDFYNARKDLNENFFLEPNNLFLTKKKIMNFLNQYDVINFLEFKNENSKELNIKKIPNLSSIKKEVDFKFIKKYFDINKNKIIYDNMIIKFNFIKDFKQITNNDNFYSTILNIPESLELDKFILINEKTLFGYNISTREKKTHNKEFFFEEVN